MISGTLIRTTMGLIKRLLLFLLDLFCFFYYSNSAASDINFNLAGEFGNFSAQHSLIEKKNDFVLKWRSSLTYQDATQNSSWSVFTKFLPEFYGLKHSNKIYKFSLGGQYQKQHTNWQWSVFLATQKQRYQTSIENFTLNSLNIGATSFWWCRPSIFFTSNFQYFYRDILNTYDQNLDAFLLQTGAGYAYSKYTNIEGGLYIEKFSIKSPDYLDLFLSENNGTIIYGEESSNFLQGKSSGWRIGPQISWKYQKKFLLNFTYRIISHQSDLSNRPVAEHWLRFIFVKIFSSKLSGLFLMDYYINQAKLIQQEDYLLAYSPLENENKIYFKLERTLSKTKTIYLKSGYLNNSFKLEDFSIKGWIFVIGFEFDFK
jgi:hypothetical protein